MDYSTAIAELNRLRGVGEGRCLATFTQDVDALYFALLGKHLPKCSCKDKEHDALIEIYLYLKKPEIKDIMSKTAKLRHGIVLYHVPGHEGVFINTNLTDEVARAYLAARPDKAHYFEVLPPMGDEPTEVTAEPKADADPVVIPKKSKKNKR